jgi:KDO2-lipid IV(A) lauroyltransferase
MKRKFKKVKRILRRPFEWLGIMLAYCCFSFSSRRVMLALSDFASMVMWRFDKKGRNRASQNLSALIPGISQKRSDIIIRRSYRNMARAVGHAFWTCRKAYDRVQESGEMSLVGKRFLSENNPAVTVSGHIGCWEILSQLALLEGHKMISVAKDIGSKSMTGLLMRARTSIGQEIVHANGAFRALLAAVKQGKSLGLLVDQAVDPSEGGIWVRFLGKPVPVSSAPAFFAAKGGLPIVVAWSRPLKDGRYRCEIISTYKASDARDIWKMTQQCIRDLESVIRRHPSCWVLNYNNFRNVPTEKDLETLAKREREILNDSDNK